MSINEKDALCMVELGIPSELYVQPCIVDTLHLIDCYNTYELMIIIDNYYSIQIIIFYFETLF